MREHPGAVDGKEPSDMKKHTLQNAIRLAESIPQDRENFQVVRELLVELNTIAKTQEATS